MNLSGAVERLTETVRVCGSPDAGRDELTAALRATTELQGYVAARRAELVAALDAQPASFPEATIADTSGCSLGEASKEKARSDTLGEATAVAEALSNGEITTGHVDALTRAGRRLGDAKGGLFDDDEELASQAAGRSVADFDRWLKRREKELDRTDATERLERQRRAARVRHWVDDDGMWNLKGRFAPDAGVELARLIDRTADRLRAGEPPAGAPADPVERDQHLKALAVIELFTGRAADGAVIAGPAGVPAATGSPGVGDAGGGRGRAGAGRGGRGGVGPPLVVIDATQTEVVDGRVGPMLDWGYPVELPRSVLEDLADRTDPDVIVVANGVVLHAPGRLDLGRTSRLANRAQRRALTGLYSTCAVPRCTVHVDRCRLHHVTWWRHGGRTDLSNLLPVCQHHHTRLHEDGWLVTLGPNRELTIRLPDGTVMTTGPPNRSAA